MGAYSNTEGRMQKPFNPLLGETFELKTKKFRFLSEQVSHHPPISACYAKGNKGQYEFWLNSYVKTQFWGAKLDVHPIGLAHIRLAKWNELYTL